MKVNWKSESTWGAIGGGLVAILTGTGVLVAEEGASLASVIASLSAGVIGLIALVRAVRDRIKAAEEDESANGK